MVLGDSLGGKGISNTGLSPSLAGLSIPFFYTFAIPYRGPHNPHEHAHGFGLFRVRSPLLAESHLFSFPEGTEMFHFPSFAFYNLCIQL